ncbi:MAG: MBL fold metallo-hydrolase [Deltaproteobacteria bacterium]|nr:MBL fold metallo-hydrolase [Deltaproteobacteria bacterium]
MNNLSKHQLPKEISKGIIKLGNDIYAIKAKIFAHIFVPGVYVFLLVRRDPFGLLLFDTGGLGSGPIIYNAIKELGFSPNDLRGVAISHWHSDHTGGLRGLIKRLSPSSPPVKIYVGERDLPLMLNRMPHKLFFHPILHIPIIHPPGRTPPLEYVRFVPLSPDNKENPLAEWGVEFIPTPGHTPGHTSYLHTASGALFSGCGLNLIGKHTVGLHPMQGDHKLALESAQKLAGLDFKYHYPVHWGLKGEEIPIEKRIPVKGPVSWLYRFFGFYPLFRYPEE